MEYNRAEKYRLTRLIEHAGLAEEAAAYREEVRKSLRAEGKSREESVTGSWDAVAARYGGEGRVEGVRPRFEVIFPEGVGSFDEMVDSTYGELDSGVRVRDAYSWVGEEFHRIVVDYEGGSVLDLRLASRNPPVGLALSIVQSWASKPCSKRDGLFREIRQVIGSGGGGEAGGGEAEVEADVEPEGGFLDG